MPTQSQSDPSSSMEELRNILFASIISADNDEFEEDVKQEVISRYNEKPEDWAYILQPLGEIGDKLIKLFTHDSGKS